MGILQRNTEPERCPEPLCNGLRDQPQIIKLDPSTRVVCKHPFHRSVTKPNETERQSMSKQYVLVVDDLRGHPRFTLYNALATGDVAGVSDTSRWAQVANGNAPFTQSGLAEENAVTFTLTATEP